jgi:hypothetical protein
MYAHVGVFMTRTFIFIILTAIVCIISLTAQPASAYLDPATGSMILQGILAGIAAVGVSIGIFWRRLKLIFSSGKKSTDETDDN